MKVRIHRGAEEVGGSCIEIESGEARILLDIGLPLEDSSSPQLLTPSVDAGSLLAILVSHPHLDHYGLLPWMPKVPVGMGAAARRILSAAAPFMRQPTADISGPEFYDCEPFHIGPFTITPFLVDHSAYDSYALLIEADNKRLFYSGDFRMHGRKHRVMERLISSPPTNIDVLLLEGTTLSRSGKEISTESEADIENEFVDLFRSTRGLVLAQTSAQNIDRIVSLYRACSKSGRTLVIDLYAALVLEATGNPAIQKSTVNNIALCIPHRQRIQIKNNGWFDMLSRHAGNRIYLDQDISRHPEKYVLLFRNLWMDDLERSGCLDGACLVHSQWEGYLDKDSFTEVNAWIEAHGIKFRQVHTSGHASPSDIKRFAQALAPRWLVPIHTSRPEGFNSIWKNVKHLSDGAWWEID